MSNSLLEEVTASRNNHYLDTIEDRYKRISGKIFKYSLNKLMI